jgi:hypothetical protein
VGYRTISYRYGYVMICTKRTMLIGSEGDKVKFLHETQFYGIGFAGTFY